MPPSPEQLLALREAINAAPDDVAAWNHVLEQAILAIELRASLIPEGHDLFGGGMVAARDTMRAMKSITP